LRGKEEEKLNATSNLKKQKTIDTTHFVTLAEADHSNRQTVVQKPQGFV
jgi:hypothetical protein